MAAVQLDLFSARERAVTFDEKPQRKYEPGIITADVVPGNEWPNENENAQIELVSGEFRFDVRGDFGVLIDHDVELWLDGEPWTYSKANVNAWVDIETERRHQEMRDWLFSQCPRAYLNAGPFIRWMRDIFRNGRAHGAELVASFSEFFGAQKGAAEYHTFVTGLALAEAGAFGSSDLPKMLSATVPPESGSGRDAALHTLRHALSCNWVEAEQRPSPRDWQACALTRMSPDAYEYTVTDPGEWRHVPDWLDDVRHFTIKNR